VTKYAAIYNRRHRRPNSDSLIQVHKQQQATAISTVKHEIIFSTNVATNVKQQKMI